jgi:gliding motility-associated-like protein
VKKYLLSLIVVCCFVLVAKAQPGPTTYTLNPQPVNGQYSTGTVVTLCYTMTGFGGCGTAEWFEGFDLNLGPGWVNVAPVTAPADCGGAAGGGQGWIWLTTNNTAVGPVGPGYFYEGPTGAIDGNPSNDWGDAGNCTWSFCVNLTVANTSAAGSLSVAVSAASDGYWGSWGGNGCDYATPITVLPPSTSISGVPLCTVTATSTSTSANNCAGSNLTLNASNATGATNYAWTGPNGYTATGQSVTIPGAQVANAGVYTVTATGTATCVGTTTVVVNPSPQLNVTSNSPVCVCNPLSLSSGLTPTPGLTIVWQGPGPFISLNANPTIACPQVTNSGTFTCTAQQASCTSQQTVTVVVSPTPSAVVSPGGSYSVCAGATIPTQTITGTPANAGLNWTNTQPGIGIPATGTGTIPSFTTVNNTAASVTSVITVTPTLGTCTGTPSTINITVGPSPTIIEPVSYLYCDGATFAGVDWGAVPSSTVVNWTNDYTASGLPASGQGNIGSFLLNNPTLGQALSTFTATPSVGTCIGTPVTFTVTVAGNGDATITDIGPLCSDVGPQTIIAADPTGTWSGDGIVSASGNTSVFDPIVAGPGQHDIYYSIAGQCGGTDGLQIEVLNVPAAFAGFDFSICEGVDSVMVGSFTNSTTGAEQYTWSPALNLSSSTTSSPTLTAVSTQTYTLTVNSGICASSDDIAVTVVPQSDATIIASGPYCADIAAVQLSSLETGGTWTGTGITNAGAGTFNPALATLGPNTITYSIGGFCPSTDTEDFVVWSVPDGTITPAGPFCIAELPITLVAASVGGTWSGTGINNAVSGSFGSATTTANSYLINYNTGGNCPHDFTTTVVVNSNSDATINAIADICNDAPAVTLTAAQAGGSWSGQGVSGGSFNPVGLIPGPYTVTYNIAGACPDSDTQDIIVLAVPDGTITPAGPFCQDALPQTLSAATTGGTWSGTGITSAANGTFGSAATPAANYLITYTTSGVCPQAFTETIQVIGNLDATIAAAGPFCENGNPQTLTAANPGGIWTATGTGAITAGGQISPTTLGAGTYTFNYNLNNSGCLSSDNVQVVINGLPIPSFTTSTTTGCSPLSVSFTNTSNPLGSNCVWYLDGAPVGSGNTFSNLFEGNSCSDVGIMITDGAGCSATITQNDVVCVVSNPSASFSWTPAEPTSGSNVFFDNLSLGGVTYTWNIDGVDYTSEDVSFPLSSSVGETFVACLDVVGVGGCMDAQCYTVSVSTSSYVYVPNSFTPDGDGFNDVFAPVVTGLSSTSRYSFSVYNRWGDLIFDTEDPKDVWVGDVNGGGHFAEDGAYVYEIKIQFSSGEEPFKRMGTVVLVR